MTHVLIANAISLAGAVLMLATGFIKTKRGILLSQCGQAAMLGSANLILGGYTGVTSAIVTMARNIICLKWDFTLALKIFFIILQASLALVFNQEGLLGICPVMSTVIYTCFLDTKSEVKLKLVIMVAQSFWIFYDFAIANYVLCAFDVGTVISNAIGIYVIKRDARRA